MDASLDASPAAPLEWSLIAAVNDSQVLHSTLLSTPAIAGHCEVILKRFRPSAARAYNEGLDQAASEILVFAHQDVYLPPDWPEKLAGAIRQVERIDPHWGVLGPVGVASGGDRIAGHVYSTGLEDYVGEPFSEVCPAASLDEMVLVLRRSSGLRFDERLPGFHLYGTDICLEAQRRGMGSYIVPAFCIHNSNGVARLPRQFWQAYFYLRRKWRDRLPIRTCCIGITRACLPLLRKRARDLLRTTLGMHRVVGVRCPDPEGLYRRLRGEGSAACELREAPGAKRRIWHEPDA